MPALNTSIRQVGARQLAAGHWQLGEDWSASVAILDSGCDSAHDDLGEDRFVEREPSVFRRFLPSLLFISYPFTAQFRKQAEVAVHRLKIVG